MINKRAAERSQCRPQILATHRLRCIWPEQGCEGIAPLRVVDVHHQISQQGPDLIVPEVCNRCCVPADLHRPQQCYQQLSHAWPSCESMCQLLPARYAFRGMVRMDLADWLVRQRSPQRRWPTQAKHVGDTSPQSVTHTGCRPRGAELPCTPDHCQAQHSVGCSVGLAPIGTHTTIQRPHLVRQQLSPLSNHLLSTHSQSDRSRSDGDAHNKAQSDQRLTPMTRLTVTSVPDWCGHRS